MTYRANSIEAYASDAAAGKPTPGGGSVSALVGALAAAMSEMTANFTVGKKRFADVRDEVEDALCDLAECREVFLELVDRDAEAYGAVDRAYAMPKGSDEEKSARRKAIRSALEGAMEVALEVMRRCAQVAALAETVCRIGNPNLITDAGVSAVLAEAACSGAKLNVAVNLKFLRSEGMSARVTAEMQTLTETVRECRERVVDRVDAYLAG